MTKKVMDAKKTIALVAHDNRKKEMMEWVDWNWEALSGHSIVCTGTTGKLIEQVIRGHIEDGNSDNFNVIKLKSGPLGGDQQLGAMIAEGKIDLMVFFWDPMMPQPHDVDVKALLRITVLYNVPTACNRATADFVIMSDLFNKPYQPKQYDFHSYLEREIE